MYAVQSALMAGIRERRPRASATASGIAAAKPIVDKTNVSGNPPHLSVGTSARPRKPPRSSATALIGPASQTPSNAGPHQARLALRRYRETNIRQTTAGRHWSSNG
jgi:hypothetical protein